MATQENAQIRATEDFREGLASFLEKRHAEMDGTLVTICQRAPSPRSEASSGALNHLPNNDGISPNATIRVRYAETDQMGVVYHGNYFTWFEVGRVDLCRQLGFEYKNDGN